MDFFTITGFIVILYLSVYVVTLCFTDCDLGLTVALYLGKKLHKLRGKVIWVTGASSGIGKAMAVCAARNGAKLVLSARRKDELEAVRSQCLEANSRLQPDDILVLPMDVTNVELHQGCFDKVLRHFGGLDVIINNAGRSQRAVWENIETAVDREIFELNVYGVVSLSRIAVKYFARKGKGHIVVTSSVAGVLGGPFSSSYSGTKHALHGYFNALRNEKLGEKLQITLLCPGPTFTDYLQDCFTEKTNHKYGKSGSVTDKRMTAERCALLSLTAVVNKLDEAWIAMFPILPLVYLMVYCPNVSKLVTSYMGAQKLYSPRDAK